MIRLLLDQGRPRSTVRHLEERGFDVCHVADIGHSRASDAQITDLAREQGITAGLRARGLGLVIVSHRPETVRAVDRGNRPVMAHAAPTKPAR